MKVSTGEGAQIGAMEKDVSSIAEGGGRGNRGEGRNHGLCLKLIQNPSAKRCASLCLLFHYLGARGSLMYIMEPVKAELDLTQS